MSSTEQTSTTAQLRERFNNTTAVRLAAELDLPPRCEGKGLSKRFAYFADDERVAVIAGPQEGADVELALAYGIKAATGRPLTLVLPEGHTNATEQRAPWLHEAMRPALFQVSRAGRATPLALRSRAETIAALAEPRAGLGPAEELGKALTPAHLGDATAGVWSLVERATIDPALDHGHRTGERSWHCTGQRVLSITRTTGGVEIAAGIHHSGAAQPLTVHLADGDTLSVDCLESLWDRVAAACERRLVPGDPKIHRPDEHWLQSMLRRRPNVLGIEQPAMREVPAWRPHDAPSRWGRGFLDLLGLDGHGNLRIIETKLAKNADDLLVLQGLDYFVWAQAHASVLRARLSAPKGATFELHYVLGEDPNQQTVKLSPCTRPLAEALDSEAIQWRFQTVRQWFDPAGDGATMTAEWSPTFDDSAT